MGWQERDFVAELNSFYADASFEDYVGVNVGEVGVSNEKPVFSPYFHNCNLFVLKNLESGEVLLAHAYYGGGDDMGRNGLSIAAEEQLKEFLGREGKKIGCSFFKPFHYSMDLASEIGGREDLGLTEYLKSKGVFMKRHPIPYFLQTDSTELYKEEELDRRRNQAFTVCYFPQGDTLDVKAFQGEQALDGEVEYSPAGRIIRIHPFDNPKSFEQSQGVSR